MFNWFCGPTMPVDTVYLEEYMRLVDELRSDLDSGDKDLVERDDANPA